MKNLPSLSIKCEDNRQGFTAGEILRGSLFVTFRQPMEMKNMKLQFYGEAYCRLDEIEDGTNGKRKNTEEVVSLVKILFGLPSDETSDNIPTHPSGSYRYDFEFHLPRYLSSSFESPKDRNIGLAYIRYYLIATITKPWASNHIKELPIMINEVLDVTRQEYSFRPGCETEKQVGWFPPYGTLKLFACVDRCCYNQGDTVLITAVAQNDHSRIMNALYAKLIRRTRYRVKDDTHTYSEDVHAIFGPRILARETVKWDDQPFELPDVGPTITQSKKIRVEYVLRIGFYECFGDEIHVDLPLAIGTTSTYLDEKRERDAERLGIPLKTGPAEVESPRDVKIDPERLEVLASSWDELPRTGRRPSVQLIKADSYGKRDDKSPSFEGQLPTSKPVGSNEVFLPDRSVASQEQLPNGTAGPEDISTTDTRRGPVKQLVDDEELIAPETADLTNAENDDFLNLGYLDNLSPRSSRKASLSNDVAASPKRSPSSRFNHRETKSSMLRKAASQNQIDIEGSEQGLERAPDMKPSKGAFNPRPAIRQKWRGAMPGDGSKKRPIRRATSADSVDMATIAMMAAGYGDKQLLGGVKIRDKKALQNTSPETESALSTPRSIGEVPSQGKLLLSPKARRVSSSRRDSQSSAGSPAQGKPPSPLPRKAGSTGRAKSPTPVASVRKERPHEMSRQGKPALSPMPNKVSSVRRGSQSSPRGSAERKPPSPLPKKASSAGRAKSPTPVMSARKDRPHEGSTRGKPAFDSTPAVNSAKRGSQSDDAGSTQRKPSSPVPTGRAKSPTPLISTRRDSQPSTARAGMPNIRQGITPKTGTRRMSDSVKPAWNSGTARNGPLRATESPPPKSKVNAPMSSIPVKTTKAKNVSSAANALKRGRSNSISTIGNSNKPDKTTAKGLDAPPFSRIGSADSKLQDKVSPRNDSKKSKAPSLNASREKIKSDKKADPSVMKDYHEDQDPVGHSEDGSHKADSSFEEHGSTGGDTGYGSQNFEHPDLGWDGTKLSDTTSHTNGDIPSSDPESPIRRQKIIGDVPESKNRRISEDIIEEPITISYKSDNDFFQNFEHPDLGWGGNKLSDTTPHTNGDIPSSDPDSPIRRQKITGDVPEGKNRRISEDILEQPKAITDKLDGDLLSSNSFDYDRKSSGYFTPPEPSDEEYTADPKPFLPTCDEYAVEHKPFSSTHDLNNSDTPSNKDLLESVKVNGGSPATTGVIRNYSSPSNESSPETTPVIRKYSYPSIRSGPENTQVIRKYSYPSNGSSPKTTRVIRKHSASSSSSSSSESQDDPKPSITATAVKASPVTETRNINGHGENSDDDEFNKLRWRRTAARISIISRRRPSTVDADQSPVQNSNAHVTTSENRPSIFFRVSSN